MKEKIYICMECGYEWEAKELHSCPRCRCADFAEDEVEMVRSFNYKEISKKNIEDNPHLIFICDGDKKEVIVEREEE